MAKKRKHVSSVLDDSIAAMRLHAEIPVPSSAEMPHVSAELLTRTGEALVVELEALLDFLAIQKKKHDAGTDARHTTECVAFRAQTVAALAQAVIALGFGR